MKKLIEISHFEHYDPLFPPVELVSNPELAELIDNIFDYSPSWSQIVDIFLSANKDRKLRYEENAIYSKFAEICVRESLRNLYANNPRFNFNPILNWQVNSNFNFKRNNYTGTFEAFSNITRNPITEYDDLFVFDKIPTIIELKMNSSINNISRSMHQDHLRLITLPIQEHFETNKIHCVYIIPPEFVLDSYQLDNIEDKRVKFQNMGGIIVPFYCSQADFKADVLEIIDEYNLL